MLGCSYTFYEAVGFFLLGGVFVFLVRFLDACGEARGWSPRVLLMTDTLKAAHRRTQAANGSISSSMNRAGHALVGRGKVRMTASLGREFTDWVMISRGRLVFWMILEAARLRKRYAVESFLEIHQMPRSCPSMAYAWLLEALGVMKDRTAAHKWYCAKRDSHVFVSISWLPAPSVRVQYTYDTFAR